MEKLILGIASALSIDAEELTALKDGEKWLDENDLAPKLAEIVKSQVSAAKDAQFKRGIREKESAVKRFLRNAGFANEAKLEGDALLEAYTDHVKGSFEPGETGKEPAKMTREELLKLPEVKTLLVETKQQAGTQFEALKSEYEQAQTKWKRERVADIAKVKLPAYLKAANVNLEVPGVADGEEKRVKAIMSMLDIGEIGLDDKGELIFLDSDGTPKLNDYGKPLDLKKHVAEVGESLFGIRKIDPGKGGANPHQGQRPGGTDPKVFTFENQAAFDSAFMNETDASKRSQMLKDFKTQAAAE